MAGKRVIVRPYDPCWPQAFRRIRHELENGLGSILLDVQHVGSTSVPGLAAKPIIDLDAIISDDLCLDIVIKRLELLGYEYEGDLGIVGREAFRYDDKPHLYRHNLYVCRESSSELMRHITFRDFLRKNPEAADEYGMVKLEAAKRHPDSIAEYAKYKSDCIHKLYMQCGLES